MKTQQTPLNTPQPDTLDVQAALDRDKAYTRKLHAVVQQIIEVRTAASDAPESRKIRLSPERVAELEAIALKTKPTATPAQASGNCQPSHSPLPWHLSAYHQHKVVARGRGDATICDCTNPIFQDLREQEANAAFIVRACNNAQRLADALKTLFRECAMVHKYWGENCNQTEADTAVTKACEALAQWEKDKQ